MQEPAHFPLEAHSLPSSSYCARQTRPFVGTSKDARGGKGNRAVVNDHVNGSGEGVEGGRADNGVCVSFPDRQMRLGAEEASAVEFDGVEDGGFVGSEDLDFPVYRARMVDVEQASRRG